VLRPHFLHPQDFAFIADASELVLSAIHKIYQRLICDPSWLARLKLSAGEQALIGWPDTFGRPDASARMDAFWHAGERTGQGTLHFIEYNADSPGGLAYGDALTELFLEQEPMRQFSLEFNLTTSRVRRKALETLLSCYRAWAAAVGKMAAAVPRIAIVDWRTVSTKNEFLLMQQVFEDAGNPTCICDPSELEYRAGRLWAGGDFQVDIVYKRLVVNEFIAAHHPPDRLVEHPLARAAFDGAVCVVNGFNVQLLYNKSLFAFLSDEENHSLLTVNEATAVQRHIPWTRLVEERIARCPGGEADLVDFILNHQDTLVLKPTREYGGRGVVLGWECGRTAWGEALKAALAQPTIVQERVPVTQVEFPFFDQGLEIQPRLVDVDPYVWQGSRVGHAGVRLSTQSILNVGSGGGSATPLFLVHPR
jgi:glutathionylspermidine synthase